MKQRIIISIFLLNFTLVFAQLEEIQKVDHIYDKKIEEIKKENKRPKKHLPILSELNKERIIEYNKILKDYYGKDSAEFTSHQNEFIKKIEKFENGEKVEGVLKNHIPEKIKYLDYKNGGIGGFRNEIGKFLIIENFPYFYNYDGKGLRSELNFTIDKEGQIKNVTATGDNDNFNTLVKVALYKTSGNWIPSEMDGRKVNDNLRLPITFQLN